MKKFTSGANGHMFCLFKVRAGVGRERKQRTKFTKGKTASLFLHISVFASSSEFGLPGQAAVGLGGVRERRGALRSFTTVCLVYNFTQGPKV